MFSSNLTLFAFPKQYISHSAEGTFIRQPTPTHNKNRDPYRCMLEWDTETTLLFKNKKSMKKDYLVNSWYTAIFNMRQII